MHNLIRGALLAQLAEFFNLTPEAMEEIERLARQDKTQQIPAHIDGLLRTTKDAQARQNLQNLRSAIPKLNAGLQFPEDFATMIVNYQKLTGREFSKPAWLSTEMKRID